MNPEEPRIETPGLEEYERLLGEAESELGLEYVGPGQGMNRRDRRDAEKTLKRITRRPVATLTMYHPLLDRLTPHGAKVMRRRRLHRDMARAARKAQYRRAAVARRQRQSTARRRAA